MFIQGLSREIGSRGITLNNVQPGPIDTDLNPVAGDWAVPQKAATALDRYGHVDEVASLLAGDTWTASLEGKKIGIIGTIDLYMGKPEIKVLSKSQIKGSEETSVSRESTMATRGIARPP
jgi:hypothetical protein